MIYSIRFISKAERGLRRLPPAIRDVVRAHIDSLAKNPRPPQSKPLVNSGGRWRLGVGEYRIIYFIRDDQLLILVVDLGHRKDIYR